MEESKIHNTCCLGAYRTFGCERTTLLEVPRDFSVWKTVSKESAKTGFWHEQGNFQRKLPFPPLCCTPAIFGGKVVYFLMTNLHFAVKISERGGGLFIWGRGRRQFRLQRNVREDMKVTDLTSRTVFYVSIRLGPEPLVWNILWETNHAGSFGLITHPLFPWSKER